MSTLLFILFTGVVSIGLTLCACYLRSRSLATLNVCIWAIATFVVGPWSYLTQKPSLDPDQQLAWDASLVWAVFFIASIIAFIYCLLASLIARKPYKRRRRRRRSSSQSEPPIPEKPEISAHDI